MDMIEKVAESLAVARENELARLGYPTTDEAWGFKVDAMKPLARAAIEAMRDLTPEMRRAAYGYFGDSDGAFPAAWQDAIDAALEQPQER